MRILMLGNSLTSANDLPALLAQTTGAHVEAVTRGGATLTEFSNPATKTGSATKTALGSNWDFVIMQDMSHLPATAPQRHMANVAKLCGPAREAGAVPVVYATWAYRDQTPRLDKLFESRDDMARRMAEGSRAAAEANSALLAPVGEAFDQAYGEHLYAKDGIHPSLEGSLLASNVITETIQGYLKNRN